MLLLGGYEPHRPPVASHSSVPPYTQSLNPNSAAHAQQPGAKVGVRGVKTRVNIDSLSGKNAASYDFCWWAGCKWLPVRSIRVCMHPPTRTADLRFTGWISAVCSDLLLISIPHLTQTPLNGTAENTSFQLCAQWYLQTRCVGEGRERCT